MCYPWEDLYILLTKITKINLLKLHFNVILAEETVIEAVDVSRTRVLETSPDSFEGKCHISVSVINWWRQTIQEMYEHLSRSQNKVHQFSHTEHDLFATWQCDNTLFTKKLSTVTKEKEKKPSLTLHTAVKPTLFLADKGRDSGKSCSDVWQETKTRMKTDTTLPCAQVQGSH